jgi:outer membrane protein
VYLKIVQLGSLVAAYDARIASLEAQARRVELLNRVGRAPRLDLLRVNTLLTRARYERLQVANRREEAYTLLYNLMGTSPPPAAPVLLAYRTETDARAAEEALAQAAASHRPELRIAEHEVAAAQAAERIARGERLPAVSVVGRYAERAGADTAFFEDWNLGVQLTLPILDGGVRRAREEQAAVGRAQAEENVRRARLDVAKQVRDAMNAEREADARLRVTERSVDESNEALSIERLRYERGVAVVTDLLDAETAVLTAQADRLQAQFDAVIARLNLLKATGELDAARIDALLLPADKESS